MTPPTLSLFELVAIALVAFGAQVGGCIVGGGGFIIQPFLLALGIPPQMAVANDVSSVAASSITAAMNFARKNLLRTDVIIPLIPGLVAGAIVGCFALHALSPALIEKVIGVFALIFLAKSLLWKESPNPNVEDSPITAPIGYSLKNGLIGFILGAYTTFSGAGVGTLAAFLLSKTFGLSFTSSLGVRWACLPVAMIIGLCTYLSLGLIQFNLFLALLIGNIFAGTLASKLALFMGERWLRPIFLTSLAGFASYLLLK